MDTNFIEKLGVLIQDYSNAQTCLIAGSIQSSKSPQECLGKIMPTLYSNNFELMGKLSVFFAEYLERNIHPLIVNLILKGLLPDSNAKDKDSELSDALEEFLKSMDKDIKESKEPKENASSTAGSPCTHTDKECPWANKVGMCDFMQYTDGSIECCPWSKLVETSNEVESDTTEEVEATDEVAATEDVKCKSYKVSYVDAKGKETFGVFNTFNEATEFAKEVNGLISEE